MISGNHTHAEVSLLTSAATKAGFGHDENCSCGWGGCSSDHAPVVADFAPAAPIQKINNSGPTTELTIYLAPDRLLQVQRSDDLITWENILPSLDASNAPALS